MNIPKYLKYAIKHLVDFIEPQDNEVETLQLNIYSIKDFSYKNSCNLQYFYPKTFIRSFELKELPLSVSETKLIYGEIANLVLYELAQEISKANDTPEDIRRHTIEMLNLLPSSNIIIANKIVEKIETSLK
jgi:hypothetical protein